MKTRRIQIRVVSWTNPRLECVAEGRHRLLTTCYHYLFASQKDVVIVLSFPHIICWEHEVEEGQAVTTKDRARRRLGAFLCNMHVFLARVGGRAVIG